MNEAPADARNNASPSNSMIALSVWCGLNLAALALAKIGFRGSAASEAVSATSAVLIAQILCAAFLFNALLKTWWHTGRVLALAATALALAVRQDQADWSALPAAWLVTSAWTLCLALQTKLAKPIQSAVTGIASLLLVGTPLLSYLELESFGVASSVLSAANAANPLQIDDFRLYHFPPPITFFAFPFIFGAFALLIRFIRSRRAALAPTYPQE